MSGGEAVHDFISFMEMSGVRPIEPIASRLTYDGIIRFRCEGDKPGRQNGWARLFLDGRPAGRFGNLRLGIDLKWNSNAENTGLSPEEKAALRREWAEAAERRRKEKENSEAEAATEALEIWSTGLRASELHPYARKKRIDVGSLKQQGDKLLIPMLDGQGKLWNLQRIAPDGSKRFLRGGRTDGLFCIIGHASTDARTWCIGEGYATMAAVHRASGHPCIVAFSAKNMAAVARLWNAARPDLNFIICADDDADNPNGNVGLKAAEAAAAEIGAKLAVPQASEAA